VFTHQGPARSPRANGVLAGFLAFVAGYVNSGGFVLIGSFTSHVTGSVGRLAHDVAIGDRGAAVFAALFVVAFFGGAFLASLMVESNGFAETRHAYGAALLTEAALLGTFIFVAGLSRAQHPRILDAEAAILCVAMGMQNSLVTRLSGAVVRTTHLTGVVTDLGIEAARWWRWYRAQLPLPRLPIFAVRNPPERPAPVKTVLLLTIVVSFVAGAVLGALLTLRQSRWAMLFPSVALTLAAAQAFGLDRPLRRPGRPDR
jgi:uncharacterized membrane protein YoaK (UPF0700 family)